MKEELQVINVSSVVRGWKNQTFKEQDTIPNVKHVGCAVQVDQGGIAASAMRGLKSVRDTMKFGDFQGILE